WGEPPEALVRPERRSLFVDDRSLAGGQPVPLEKLPVVTAAEEARLLALAPLCNLQARALRLRAGLVLRLLTEREPDSLQPARVEASQHVRLVLPLVDRAGEQEPATVLDDPSIVAGRKPGRPGVPREFEELREAKAAVATRARVRCLAARVALHERLHDR